MNDIFVTNIKAILDDTLAEFEKNKNVIFGSDSTRLKTLFSSMTRSLKAWRIPKQCAFDRCTKPSIPRSHTIQKSGSLLLIAENQHVLQPVMGDRGMIEMSRVGLNDASVFPGFCKQHEALFADFEQTKTLSSPRDIVLQCFRAVCRELVRIRFEVEQLEITRDEYCRLRNSYIVATNFSDH